MTLCNTANKKDSTRFLQHVIGAAKVALYKQSIQQLSGYSNNCTTSKLLIDILCMHFLHSFIMAPLMHETYTILVIV